ncbi:MAG: hypothetical protein RLZZ165_259 [Bacteroidota bacterium]
MPGHGTADSIRRRMFLHGTASYRSRVAALLLCCCLAAIAPGRLPAQQTHPLTLAEAIHAGQTRSPAAKIAGQNLASAHWDYQAFRTGLLPQLRADVNAPGLIRTIGQIIQPDGTIAFRQQNRAFSSANVTLSQQIAPTGGSIYLSSGLTRLDVFGTNGYRFYQATPLLVGFSQPIFDFNPLRWQQKIRPVQYEVAERRYLEALEDAAVDIADKYFEVYISQMSLENAQFNLSITDSIHNISEGRYKVGKIAENDLLQTELAFLNAKVQVQQAEVSIQKARLELAIALGIENAEGIVVEHPEALRLIDVNPGFAIAEAFQNRSAPMDYEARGLEAESAVAQASAGTRPTASLTAAYGLNNSDGTIGESYQNLAKQQTASIGFSIPILQWGRGKARVQSALVQKEQVKTKVQLEQRMLERDIRFTVMDFLQMQQQLVLASKSDTIAQRRFEVAKNRYLIGKIDITNLQIAQNEKDNARLGYVRALQSYWVAYFRLRRAALYDFVNEEKLRLPELRF